jgi:hypothetical protein
MQILSPFSGAKTFVVLGSAYTYARGAAHNQPSNANKWKLGRTYGGVGTAM